MLVSRQINVQGKSRKVQEKRIDWLDSINIHGTEHNIL